MPPRWPAARTISIHAVRRMADVWRNFHANQVYRADSLGVLRTGARWLTLMSVGWVLARWRKLQAQAPAGQHAAAGPAAQTMVPLERCRRHGAEGHLRALAVTASSYSSGEHVTFFEAVRASPALDALAAPRVRDRITTSICWPRRPFRSCFRPRPSPGRMAAPSTSATARCASRRRWPRPSTWGPSASWWSGAGRMHEPKIGPPPGRRPNIPYPSLAQIAGHALSNIFLDALAVDVERVRRINHTIGWCRTAGPRSSSGLRPIELLVIAPSQRIDAMAARHVATCRRPVRTCSAAGRHHRQADARARRWPATCCSKPATRAN
jgi:NTE family protein